MGLNNCLLMLLTLIYKDLLFVCFQFSIVILCSLEQYLWQFFETELKVPLGNVCGMLLVGTWAYLSCGRPHKR